MDAEEAWGALENEALQLKTIDLTTVEDGVWELDPLMTARVRLGPAFEGIYRSVCSLGPNEYNSRIAAVTTKLANIPPDNNFWPEWWGQLDQDAYDYRKQGIICMTPEQVEQAEEIPAPPPAPYTPTGWAGTMSPTTEKKPFLTPRTALLGSLLIISAGLLGYTFLKPKKKRRRRRRRR